MPRKFEAPVIDVNVRRVENYTEHYDARQYALHHPRLGEIARMVEGLPVPGLDVFGNACIAGRDFVSYPVFSGDAEPYWALGKALNVHAWLLFRWYWSDAGWVEFEKLWQALPEVVHIPMCTSGKVVHIRTQEVFTYPSSR